MTERGRETSKTQGVLEGQPDAGTHCAAFDGGASTDNVPVIKDTLSYLSAAIQAYHSQL